MSDIEELKHSIDLITAQAALVGHPEGEQLKVLLREQARAKEEEQIMAGLAEDIGGRDGELGELVDRFVCAIHRQAEGDTAYSAEYDRTGYRLNALTEAEWFDKQADYEKLRLISVALRLVQEAIPPEKREGRYSHDPAHPDS